MEPAATYRLAESDLIADRYQVITPLGSSSHAEVYHCLDRQLARAVVVRVLIEKWDLQEVRLAAQLEHPNIIQVYDISTLADETSIIVSRYVEGDTLDEYLDKAEYRRLPFSENTLRIVRQIAEALNYAHELGMIHRHVKPSNIIMDRQGNAYLIDFGLAGVRRLIDEKDSMVSVEIPELLGSTIPYMAPEQLHGHPGDERSDLYSLGVVTYEVLTGQLPYRGRDAALISDIAASDPLPPTVANPELPPGIESVLLQALDKDPDKRFHSCIAFALGLEDSAHAYRAAIEEYERARRLFANRQWRDALHALEALDRSAPGFEDSRVFLEQTRLRVWLLDVCEKAEKALKEGKYQYTLAVLDILAELAPDHAVSGLRQQAEEGLAQELERSLDRQYRQAVQQLRKGEYQACLDTLGAIRERDPDYPDPAGIEEDARREMERQHMPRASHTRASEQMDKEEMSRESRNRVTLLQNLKTYYNESELRDLCFVLDVDYDVLPGEGTGDKARELILHFERHRHISELLGICKRLRPKLPW